MVSPANEHTVDQLALLIMFPGASDIDLIDQPSVRCDLRTDVGIEILILVDTVAITYERMIKEENQSFCLVGGVILAEVITQGLQLPFVFHIERFKDPQLTIVA